MVKVLSVNVFVIKKKNNTQRELKCSIQLATL